MPKPDAADAMLDEIVRPKLNLRSGGLGIIKNPELFEILVNERVKGRVDADIMKLPNAESIRNSEIYRYLDRNNLFWQHHIDFTPDAMDKVEGELIIEKVNRRLATGGGSHGMGRERPDIDPDLMKQYEDQMQKGYTPKESVKRLEDKALDELLEWIEERSYGGKKSGEVMLNYR